jgi:hypothetical protein
MIENSAMSANFVYYIGDLCYVLTDDEWDVLCGQVPSRTEMFDDLDSEDGYDNEFFLDVDKLSAYAVSLDCNDYEEAKPFVCFSTAYGDGQYNDLEGNPYAVDSGTIGMIDVRYVSDGEKLERAVQNGLGHLFEVDAQIDPSECYYDDGVITFGAMSVGVEIDTN